MGNQSSSNSSNRDDPLDDVNIFDEQDEEEWVGEDSGTTVQLRVSKGLMQQLTGEAERYFVPEEQTQVTIEPEEVQFVKQSYLDDNSRSLYDVGMGYGDVDYPPFEEKVNTIVENIIQTNYSFVREEQREEEQLRESFDTLATKLNKVSRGISLDELPCLVEKEDCLECYLRESHSENNDYTNCHEFVKRFRNCTSQLSKEE